MLARLQRAFRSLFGSLVRSVEDPEKILEQNLRDLNDQVPRLNENLAMVRANVALLEKERTRTRSELAELTSKAKAAIGQGRDDLAATYATRLQHARTRLERNEAQLASARDAYDRAIDVKRVFLREKERKTEEAMRAIRDHRRARWQARVTDALASFRVAGLDQTHDEMIRRLEEGTALDEARMSTALEAVDARALAVEEEAERLRAEALVRELKREMGLLDERPAIETRALPERSGTKG